jgi:hypothetical protein
VFGLQGYITDLELIVTTLLIDRSWAIRGCVDFFFVISFEHNSITPSCNLYYFLTIIKNLVFTLRKCDGFCQVAFNIPHNCVY